MQKEIVGLNIQELIWSHETTELLRVKLAEEGITAYFFQEGDTKRYFGCLADDESLKVIYKITPDNLDMVNPISSALKTAAYIFEREYQKLYFTRHASDAELLQAMIYDKREMAPESAKIFCYFVALHNTVTELLGRPKSTHFFSFQTLVWHSRPRVTIAGKMRHVSRTHTRKLIRGLKTAVSISVKYEFFRDKRAGRPPANTNTLQDGLTMYLSMSYPDGNWESAEVFVNHPNRKPLINLFYGHTEE